jgi:phosphoserine phosphatase
VTHVLTLIAKPALHPLQEDAVSAVRAAIPCPGAPEWLSPGEACDIGFVADTPAAATEARSAARDALEDRPVDMVCQSAEKRRKRLLVADMDSTLINQECIDEIADFAGLKPKIAAITEQAMRGELEFESALRERVGLLAGLSEEVLHAVFAERITLMPGARVLARTMATHGAKTVIVSGGFTYFTERVAQAAGFAAHHANTLEIAGGKLSGKVRDPILGQQAKLNILRRYRGELSLSREETMAVGDGANDLAMLAEAGLGIAYRAKPIVAEKAKARIDKAELTALLFAQGYRRKEFVED